MLEAFVLGAKQIQSGKGMEGVDESENIGDCARMDLSEAQMRHRAENGPFCYWQMLSGEIQMVDL